MAQSLANILLHVVFSTKNRAPYLDTPAVREGMSGDLVGTLRNIIQFPLPRLRGQGLG